MDVYHQLVRDVLEHGTRKPNRTGVDTISRFNFNYTIDLADGFPLLTTKKISWKNIVAENLWFLSGQRHIGILQRHKLFQKPDTVGVLARALAARRAHDIIAAALDRRE